MAWEVRQWCKNEGVNYDEVFKAWMSEVLKKKANSVIYAQAAHIKDFDSLIRTLHARCRVQSRTCQRMNDFKKTQI